MKRGVLWDSSAIVAALDAGDRRHEAAVAIAERLAAERWLSLITNYLEAEAHALLLRRLGRGAALGWLLKTTIPVLRALPADEQRAKEILARYRDKDFSLCDAISFAVMRRLGVRTAFSFDRHFQQYGRFEVLGAGDVNG
jgi:predicted nucleic acid-binding protein